MFGRYCVRLPLFRSLLIAALLAAPAVAPAAPLQPTGKWQLYYLPSSCAVERHFGDYILGFETPPLGNALRLVIVGPGRSNESRQLESLVELSDGGPPIKASSLVYGTSKKGRRGITTILSPADSARVAGSKWLRLSTLGTGPKSKRTSASADPIFTAEFDVGSTAALAKEMEKCLNDLRRHWGIVDGELPKPAQGAKLSLQGIFRSSDYPRDAMNAEQTGSTGYLLMIDEKGSILDCMISETSGVASLDAMGCQVIRERAKVKQPAMDSSGMPVKSIYVSRVVWDIRW